MKKVVLDSSWPESWKYSYHYDLMEVYGSVSHKAYAYTYANRRQRLLDIISKVASPGARILDVAAAQGNFTLLLAELGYEMTWNDLREELVDYVKIKHEYGTINYVPGNIFEINFEDYFDIVLIAEVIEHVAHPDRFLQTIAGLVKPGGYIVMSTPNGEYIRNTLPKFSKVVDPTMFESIEFQPDADGHIFLLHFDEIQDLAAKCSLKVEEIHWFNNPLTNGHLKMAALTEFIPRNGIEMVENLTGRLSQRIRRKIHTNVVALFAKLSESLPDGT